MKAIVEERGPWKTRSIEERYATPWISVSHHEVIDPSGQDGIYGVIHFKNIAVGVVPLDADGNTWIIGQYRYPIKAYSWEIPEGGGRRDLPPLDSAKRELREEAGIVAEQWTPLLEMDLSNSASDEHAVIFVAQGLTFHKPEPDHNEDLALRMVPFDELYGMVMRGDVRDSLTVAAVLKVKLLLYEGALRL
ncbi:MAG: NUDIX hydrolase [Flavobacteriales bacterium]|nr:NUDIX hydrolase [Flavobacteriales bacterium]